MKRFNIIERILFIVIATSLLVVSGNIHVFAQPGPSVTLSCDVLPFQDFADPIDTGGGNYINNAQTRLSKTRISFSLPVMFSEGRTVLINEFSYQLIDFEYRNFSIPISRLHAASYTMMLHHQLSEKWSMLALGTPSMASDLKADISEDDFNFQAAIVFIRRFSERLSVGLGAAYTTQFGSADPLPVLAFDWNNGKNLMVKAILPASLEFWYRSSSRLDLGLLVSGDGNNFHGDPDVYDVANPEMRYTMLTIGPAAKISLSKKLKLKLEAGLIGLHRFEWYGDGIEVGTYDLEPSQYVRFGLTFGNEQ